MEDGPRKTDDNNLQQSASYSSGLLGQAIDR